MLLYIAGPMTGIPEFNFPAFETAETALTEAGYEVLNPTRHGSGDLDKQWIDYLIPCLRDVMAADGVALLDGWSESKGARVEQKLAQVHDKPTCALSLWLVHAATGISLDGQ